ncbi:hypothetical protein EMCRGX_G020389 [Ephydatia muelleri]
MTSTYCRKTSYTPVVVSVIIAYVYGGIGPTSHRISGMDSRIRPAVRIYECFVEVARPKDNEDAQIKYVYPKDYAWEVDTKRQLPKFVFPNKFVNEQEEHFTFVLTDLDGKYRFGFCRYPPGGGDVAMCFLSDLPWFKVFYQAMDKIRDLRLDHQGEVVEPFLAGFRNHSLPMANDSVISIVPEGIDVGQVFTFALPDLRKLPEIPADMWYFENILVHFESILVHFENILVHFESILVHFESILVHFESILVHFESILVHFESILVHFESILVHFESILVHFESILVHFESILVHFESILVHFESILVHFESILVHFESILVHFESILVHFESILMHFESILVHFESILCTLRVS